MDRKNQTNKFAEHETKYFVRSSDKNSEKAKFWTRERTHQSLKKYIMLRMAVGARIKGIMPRMDNV